MTPFILTLLVLAGGGVALAFLLPRALDALFPMGDE